MPRRRGDFEPPDFGTFAIDPARPVAEQLYQALREKIISIEIEPGAVVSEVLVAEAAKVSKTPARQAIKQLVSENLLVSLPSRGTFVPLLDRQRIADSLLIRAQTEPQITRMAAAKPDRRELNQTLSRLLDEHQTALARDDLALVRAVDARFHETICDSAGSPLLWQIVKLARSESDRARRLWQARRDTVDAALDQHRQIAVAISSGAQDDAYKAMEIHVGLNRMLLDDLVNSYPDYFL